MLAVAPVISIIKPGIKDVVILEASVADLEISGSLYLVKLNSRRANPVLA